MQDRSKIDSRSVSKRPKAKIYINIILCRLYIFYSHITQLLTLFILINFSVCVNHTLVNYIFKTETKKPKNIKIEPKHPKLIVKVNTKNTRPD